MTKFARNSYTFREGLTMMAAKALGIDPDLAVEAGESATAVINLIRHAAKLRGPGRDAALRDAERELRRINPRQHPELVQALYGKMMHVAGHGRASVNPATGAEEFFWPFDQLKDAATRVGRGIGNVFGLGSARAKEPETNAIEPIVVTARRQTTPQLRSRDADIVDHIHNQRTGLARYGIKSMPLEPISNPQPSPNGSANSLKEVGRVGQRVGPPIPKFKPARPPELTWDELGRAIHSVAKEARDLAEPIDAVTSVLPAGRILKQFVPRGVDSDMVVEGIGKAAIGADLASRVTEGFAGPGSIRPLPSRPRTWLADAYQIADTTNRYAGDIALTTGVMSFNPAWAPVTAPTAAAMGTISGGAYLTRGALKRYCKRNGFNDDCT
ncbi:MAG: hypothetical protein SFV19_06585 [Rhodospirillaceae bacterium]|nr:hypothetical protein [Rhodospirillaceae bacterium]